VLSIFADVYDWSLFNIQTPEANAVYQSWDRLMDMYFWVITIFVVWKWEDTRSRTIAFALLGFRVVGQLIFFVTQERRFLFYFPNFYDNFLVVYMGFVLIFKRTRLIDAPLDAFVLIVFLGIPKIVHEYFLHYLQLQPWERYPIGNLLEVSRGPGPRGQHRGVARAVLRSALPGDLSLLSLEASRRTRRMVAWPLDAGLGEVATMEP